MLLLAAVACAETPAAVWATEAERYFDAMDEAGARSISEQARRFYAEDVLLDTWRTDGFTCAGRDRCARWLTARAGAAVDAVTTTALYLDASGAARAVQQRGPGLDATVLVLQEIGADGRVTVEVRPRAVGAVDSVDPATLRLLTAPAVAYREAWSGGDSAAVGALYADDAVVVDSLLGLHVTGRRAIEDLAQRDHARAASTLRPDDLDGAGAVHLRFPTGFAGDLAGTHELHLALEVDGGGCTDRVVTVLRLEDGRIQRERRFHEVGSVRRCGARTDVQRGWWEGPEVPPVLDDRITARIEVDGQRVTIRSGTPELERLVRWSLERFPAAGLAVPPVQVVAFDAAVHPLACPQDRDGGCVTVDGASAIYVCADPDDVCADATCTAYSPRWRTLLLHELAHAWLAEHVDAATEQRFVELRGLADWDWIGVTWASRGVEQAAEIVAWGLVEDPLPLYRLGPPPCDELADAFQLLTGHASVGDCASVASE